MNRLIITLPLELPQASSQLEYALSPDGRTLASHSRAAPALLPQVANGEIVVVVPVQALSWHQVQLPRGLLSKNFLSEAGSPRLRAALEGLLEERLLDEPTQLHFALAPDARDGAPVWVAACDRAWLRAWLQTLESSRHAVTRIVPEFAPDDEQSNGAPDNAADVDGVAEVGANVLHVIGTPQQPYIVFTPIQTEGEGTADRGLLAVLPLSLSSVAMANWPETANILAEPSVAALAEDMFKRRVNLQQNAQRALRASRSDWDLAQFDLQNNQRSRSWKRVTGIASGLMQSPRWRAARFALGGLVAANLVGLNAWAWAERNRVESKEAAIKDVLTATFPSVKVVVDAPVQMARELALLRQGAGGTSSSDFDSLLASFGALSLTSKSPTSIEYAANEIRIKGLDLSSAQVAQAADQLKRQGLRLSSESDTVLIKAQPAP
jgi:general secretion pathway protein L